MRKFNFFTSCCSNSCWISQLPCVNTIDIGFWFEDDKYISIAHRGNIYQALVVRNNLFCLIDFPIPHIADNQPHIDINGNVKWWFWDMIDSTYGAAMSYWYKPKEFMITTQVNKNESFSTK